MVSINQELGGQTGFQELDQIHPGRVERPGRDPVSREPHAEDFFQALEEGGPRKLYHWLAKAGESQKYMAANLPATTFSEFLRCLDPFVVSRDVDPASGIALGPGAAQFTSLGQFVNRQGIRLVHVSLLHRLLPIYDMRAAAGHRLLLDDFGVLIRCAGAA